MKKFLGKLAAFALINLAAQLVLLSVMQRRFAMENWETESVFMGTPRDRHYDMAFMGTSHGKIYSRSGNHQRVEEILGKKMFNLSKGGGGVLAELVFLENFYERGNKADEIVYFVDAWPLSSRRWNEDLFYLVDEPFKLEVLPRLIARRVSAEVLLNYYKSKFSINGWFTIKPDRDRSGQRRVIKNYSPELVAERLQFLYPDGVKPEVFERYAKRLAQIVELAQSRGARVTFVLPPTLLGEEPGSKAIAALMSDFKAKYGVAGYDFSRAIPDHSLYYDVDHLNTDGVVAFTKAYLKPALLEAHAVARSR
jgi:hypothetical protein